MINFDISSQFFHDEYFEKKPYLFKAAIEENTMSWEEIDDAVYVGESYGSGARLNKNGYIKETEYTREHRELGIQKRIIDKAAFYKRLQDGATMVYNRMELVSPKIRAICKLLSRFTGEQAVANGYLAFGSDEALGKHWDTHDVFAVQLKGKKRWVLYGSTYYLPLFNNKSNYYASHCPAEPVMDFILEEGDILYVPRGWWHAALPLSVETFHLAVGIHGETMIDYIKHLAEYELGEYPEFRKMMRLNENYKPSSKDMEELAFILADVVSSKKNLDQFNRSRRERQKEHSSFDIQRHCADAQHRFDDREVFVVNTKLDAESLKRSSRLNGMSVNMSGIKLHEVLNGFVFGEQVSFSYADLMTRVEDDEKEEVNRQLKKLLQNSILDQIKR